MIFINGIKINIESFPNHESIIDKKILDSILYEKDIVDIILKYESDCDLIHLMMIKDYVDKQNIEIINLTILYLCYSRMDREIEHYLFTLKSISSFINNLNFNKVFIIEPHSNISTNMINNSVNIPKSIKLAVKLFNEQHLNEEQTTIFYPDKGARNRFGDILNLPIIHAEKERDLQTGKIISYQLNQTIDKPTKNVIIVDDLSSAGGTFMFASKLLSEAGYENIYLVVTHCENTMFENGQLLRNELIKKIYTTNSILNDEKYSHDKVVVENIL